MRGGVVHSSLKNIPNFCYSRTVIMTNDDTTTELTPATAVKRLRLLLGVTQEGLAKALGISTKAVQSYEQGWRKTPLRVVKQMLTLVAMHREDYSQSTPCWEIRGCDADSVANCPANTITHGRYCWAVASKSCAKARGDKDISVLGCLECEVVKKFLET
jgi:DNA-binding transcriptional regulator YiaG